MDNQNKETQNTKTAAIFTGFVLLSENKWDKNKLLSDLKNDWGIELDGGKDDDAFVADYQGGLIPVNLMPAPIPNGEAEENAQSNYLWPEAVEVTKQHKAFLLVAVTSLNKEADKKEFAKSFVKVVDCCCKQETTIGVYTSGTVFEPEFYQGWAQIMKEDELPIYNLIWFGLYRNDDKICCYTDGMKPFGKDDMEVLDGTGNPEEVRGFMFDMVSYVLNYDVTLNDGETIGFSEDDKHTITRSKGVSLPDDTLKISYKA